MTITLALIDALLGAVVADPDDPVPRLAMADALEERGNATEASFWRWAARSGSRPYFDYKYLGRFPWRWIASRKLDDARYPGSKPHHVLPPRLHKATVDDMGCEGVAPHSQFCNSAESAWGVALAGWLRLTEAERRGLSDG